MKNYLLAAALTAAPVFALAQSANTILFQGEVTDQTCAVSVNGNAGTSFVLLPTVSTSALSRNGATAGVTKFDIGVTDCTASKSGDREIKTLFIGNQVTAGGNLGNAGSATNVALQLLDPQTPDQPFKLNGSSVYEASGLKLVPGKDSAEYTFAVRYVAEGGVAAAGTVLGSVQYALSYR